MCPQPAVILSGGFLQPSSAYGILAEALLAAGAVLITYDKPFERLTAPVDDLDSAELLGAVAAEALRRLDRGDARGGGSGGGSRPVFLAGHSRGAKISVLAAVAAAAAAAGSCGSDGQPPPQSPSSALAGLSGLVLLDPADGSYEPQDPFRFPSSLAVLRTASAAAATAEAAPSDPAGSRLAALPALVVGAGRNGDCVPRKANYGAFFEAWPGPSALVTLQDAGHLQFLDPSPDLQRAVCAAGRGLAPGQVASAAGALAAAFVRGVAARREDGATTAAFGCGHGAAAGGGSRRAGEGAADGAAACGGAVGGPGEGGRQAGPDGGTLGGGGGDVYSVSPAELRAWCQAAFAGAAGGLRNRVDVSAGRRGRAVA
ncbi:hypothetical protein GPECTOR_160g116 [Gonium pectorale]|uniref:Chlorophyllase n=1 Tax=Gonium pectorale TaxID=33097 RepID=A0A150FXI1_GONPE|nr:hypothetical protein GPECTOR_160g116 [Gonium pectorale]|eukprot:KXZ42334.1 hypothetical protein GPECTOR_160g116 [Gonium pectorale]